MDKIQKRVVIIGAGIAGLSAGQHLVANGLNSLLILEASDRIGGRIHTVQFGKDPECVVELGANYIEGLALTNSVATLANERCSINMSKDRILERTMGYFYRSDGRAIQPEFSSRVFDLFDDWLDDDPDNNPNVEQYYRGKLKKYVKRHQRDFDEDAIENANSILNYYMNFVMIWQGSPLRDSPFEGPGSYAEDEIPGGALRVGGMSALTDALKEDIGDAMIKLNQEVKLINMEKGKVVLSTASGETYEADHVIVTCPLGYLKENARTLFRPALPRAKQEAIDKMGFGKIGKVFLQYERPFWAKGSGRMCLAWTDEERKMKSDKEWYKNIEAFDEVVDNDNVLVCWVSNEGVDAIETMDEEELKLSCTAVLRKFLQNPAIAIPVDIKRTGWASNPLYRGTYVYDSNATRDEHYQGLEEPLWEGTVPRVLFAGAAMRSSGCMHGARDSGLREAEKLLRLYDMQKVPCI